MKINMYKKMLKKRIGNLQNPAKEGNPKKIRQRQEDLKF